MLIGFEVITGVGAPRKCRAADVLCRQRGFPGLRSARWVRRLSASAQQQNKRKTEKELSKPPRDHRCRICDPPHGSPGYCPRDSLHPRDIVPLVQTFDSVRAYHCNVCSRELTHPPQSDSVFSKRAEALSLTQLPAISVTTSLTLPSFSILVPSAHSKSAFSSSAGSPSRSMASTRSPSATLLRLLLAIGTLDAKYFPLFLPRASSA